MHLPPVPARPLPGPYSRLGLQAVHHGHEVVGDQTLLARGERLRPPPLPAPARTRPPESPPRCRDHRRHRGTDWGWDTGTRGPPRRSLTLPGRAASRPSAAPGPRRGWARSRTGPPPACLGEQGQGGGSDGGTRSHPPTPPQPALTLQGGARRRRGLVGHQGVAHLGAIADQLLGRDRGKHQCHPPTAPRHSWGGFLAALPPTHSPGACCRGQWGSCSARRCRCSRSSRHRSPSCSSSPWWLHGAVSAAVTPPAPPSPSLHPPTPTPLPSVPPPTSPGPSCTPRGHPPALSPALFPPSFVSFWLW